MYDMRTLKMRYFELILKDGTHIDVEPPKMKFLKKLNALAKASTETEYSDTDELRETDEYDGLIELLAKALSKNKQGHKITKEYLFECNFYVHELIGLLTAYFAWVAEIQDSKN